MAETPTEEPSPHRQTLVALEAQYRRGYSQGYRDALCDLNDKRVSVRAAYRHLGVLLDGWLVARHKGAVSFPPRARGGL